MGSNSDRRIGYIGLGNMGKGMALRLVDAGLDVRVYDIDAKAMQAFAARGVPTASSVKEIGAWADICISCLPNGEIVREVLTGPEGLIGVMRSGGTVIDMSTIGPRATRDMAKQLEARGIRFVESPVGLGPVQAASGELIALNAGEKAVCEELRWIFEKLARKIYYCGEIGSGQAIKVANNLVAVGSLALIAEAYGMAKKAGADVRTLVDFWQHTLSDSAAVRRVVVPRVLENNYAPTMRLVLGRKDVGLAVELGTEVGQDNPCSRSALATYDKAIARGYGELDFAAVFLAAEG